MVAGVRIGSDGGNFEQSIPLGSVRLRLQHTTSRKSLTFVEGLPQQIDLRVALKSFRKAFYCNGYLVKDEATGMQRMVLTGDQRSEVMKYLKDHDIVPQDCIRVCGL
jgi:translation initiation factor 1